MKVKKQEAVNQMETFGLWLFCFISSESNGKDILNATTIFDKIYGEIIVFAKYILFLQNWINPFRDGRHPEIR